MNYRVTDFYFRTLLAGLCLCLALMLSTEPIGAEPQSDPPHSTINYPTPDFFNTDGANPEARLLQGVDGNFYGITEAGGTIGVGTVFKMTPSGTLTVLHNFSMPSSTFPYGNADGLDPVTRLVQGEDGSLYGTTQIGGADGHGTIFKITPAGTLTTLVSFTGDSGSNPGDIPGTLIRGSDGNFYGTTFTGGASRVGTFLSHSVGFTDDAGQLHVFRW